MLGAHRFEPLGIPAHDGDAVAGAGDVERDSPTDPAAAAGHHDMAECAHFSGTICAARCALSCAWKKPLLY